MSATTASAAANPVPHHPWVVRAGNFFFRVRNGLFPVIYVALLLAVRPDGLFGDPDWSRGAIALGGALAVLGQLIRLFTIGFDYIDRGGKDGKVYASRLVHQGVFAHCRNPMYVGNALIAVGMVLYSGSRWAALLAGPFFLFVYWAITAAEEVYLQGRFGAEYDAYCRSVNRYWPSWSGWSKTFEGFSYDWKKALRKEYGTLFVVAMGLLWMPAWRAWAAGAPRASLREEAAATAVAFVLYLAVRVLKKAQRLG